jgi:predicted AAA+ superfamily ATPase
MNKYRLLIDITQEQIREVNAYPFARVGVINQIDVPKKSLLLVRGFRGVGKTTAILQYLSRRQVLGASVLYVPANSTFIENLRLIDIAKTFRERGGGILAIDEIHKYPTWKEESLDIVNFFSNIQLVCSGSASLRIQGGADLSRRHVIVNVPGLSFREWLELEHGVSLEAYAATALFENSESCVKQILNKMRASHLSIVQEFHRYLKEGYFPTRRHFSSSTLYYQSLVNSADAVIDQDISDERLEMTMATKIKIKRLLALISGQCPFTPNISSLRKSLEFGDDKTVKKYLWLLSESEILTNLYQSNQNTHDLEKPEKIYLGNPNLMYALQEKVDLGTLRETYVATSLKRIGKVLAPKSGDILFDNRITFEIGGKKKTKKQVRRTSQAYVLQDDTEHVYRGQLPIWLLGFLW